MFMRKVFGAAVALAPVGATTHGSWEYASSGCAPSCTADAHWQDHTWALASDKCQTGRNQSPIDIVTTGDARPSTTHLLKGSLTPWIPMLPVLPVNTGHSFQLHETSPEFKAHPDACPVDGAQDCAEGPDKGHTDMRGQRYNFYQVH